MSSRVVARRGGKALKAAAAKRSSNVAHSLFPKGPLKRFPVSLRQPSPLQQTVMALHKQQKRSFSTLQRLRDVILQRPNPVLVALQEHELDPSNMEELHTAAYNERKSITDLPDFSGMEPHHFEPAARQAQANYEQALRDFEKRLEASDPQELEYDNVVLELDRIEGPFRVLSQIYALLHQIHQDPVFQIAIEAASQQLHDHHTTSQIIMNALQTIEARLVTDETVNSETKRRRLWAVQHLLKNYETVGMKLEHEDRETLANIRASVAETEKQFAAKVHGLEQKRLTTREKLQQIYYILSLRSEEAKRLGFDSYTDMAFSSKSRMASSVDQVRSLHEKVVTRVLPIVSSEDPVDIWQETNLLSYLTLDGVLGGVFGLSRALFGIVVHEQVEPDSVNGWHPDVRLFHVFDEDSSRYLGSFYLDPYRRQIKSDRPFVGSILQKSGNSVSPLVCLNCNIRPPVWDHMPTEVTLDDAQSVFHEFGHVLQYLLAQDDVGGVFGAHNMQIDAEEILPQFMEHWLYQEPVLQSLAQLSQADEVIPKQMIENVLKQRSYRKAHEIMHRIFLSELEFSLFSGIGDESLVAVLRRIADTYRAHDPLHKSDIWPVLELFEDNVRGERATRYRYLWSEVMSADAFDVFQKAGLANEEEVKRLGRLFREMFLDPGASVDTREAFQRFRGRDMSPDALFEMYGY